MDTSHPIFTPEKTSPVFYEANVDTEWTFVHYQEGKLYATSPNMIVKRYCPKFNTIWLEQEDKEADTGEYGRVMTYLAAHGLKRDPQQIDMATFFSDSKTYATNSPDQSCWRKIWRYEDFRGEGETVRVFMAFRYSGDQIRPCIIQMQVFRYLYKKPPHTLQR